MRWGRLSPCRWLESSEGAEGKEGRCLEWEAWSTRVTCKQQDQRLLMLRRHAFKVSGYSTTGLYIHPSTHKLMCGKGEPLHGISLLLKILPFLLKIWELHDSWNNLTLYVIECPLTDDSKESMSQSEKFRFPEEITLSLWGKKCPHNKLVQGLTIGSFEQPSEIKLTSETTMT